MATYALREAVNLSAMALPPQESEFDRAGVTRRAAELCKAQMVAESPVHFECRYLSTHRFNGHSKVGTIDIVFAQVERIHIDDDFVTPEGKLDIRRIRPLARLGYYDYTSVTDIFEMRIPNASTAEADGLEGAAK